MPLPLHPVVIFGATGFTGRLAAEYLSQQYVGPGKKKGCPSFGISGRSRAKLEELKASLVAENPACETAVTTIVADSADRPSIDAMVKSASVVLAMAGPFSLYGTPVVDACVDHRRDYVDITGEVPWVAAMIAKHHDSAAKAGVRIVPCCGFDSVPTDLLALLVATKVAESGAPCAVIEHVITAMGPGGVSGGTAASVAEMVARGDRKALADPFLLSAPAGVAAGPDADSAHWPSLPRYSTSARRWTAPFPMAAVNERVVRRTAALLAASASSKPEPESTSPLRQSPFVPAVAITERLATASWAAAALGGLATSALTAAAGFPPAFALLKLALPKPGQGPSRGLMARGHLTSRAFGSSADGGVTAAATGVIQGDPGYLKTAAMAAEAAVCLAAQRGDLESAAAAGRVVLAGVLTPASGLGMLLVRRLNDAPGFSFRVDGA